MRTLDRPLRISIAEDNADVREALKSMVACLGHEVVCAAKNGQELVDAVAGRELDLVIADLEMPVLDGLAAAEEITQTRKVPVILLSGHADILAVVEQNEPIALRLLKPVTLDRLRLAIEQVTCRG